MGTIVADVAQLWLRSHRAGERNLQRALREYFNGQAIRVADALGELNEITLAVVPLVFQPDIEAESLRVILRPHLVRLLVRGASDELSAIERVRTPSKASDDDIPFSLPERVRARIRQALQELETQPYWEDLQTETLARIAETIRQGIEETLSNYQIGMRIREHLGGMAANKRAQRIARTEVTGALNAGHEAAREELYPSGLVTGKQWLTVGDNDVRADHLALDAVTVGPKEPFIVGSSSAPYPGWWGLPADQRINCRCTTVSTLG